MSDLAYLQRSEVTYINPGCLEVVTISVGHCTESLGDLYVLGFHLGNASGSHQHGKLGQTLDVGIPLQLGGGGWGMEGRKEGRSRRRGGREGRRGRRGGRGGGGGGEGGNIHVHVQCVCTSCACACLCHSIRLSDCLSGPRWWQRDQRGPATSILPNRSPL